MSATRSPGASQLEETPAVALIYAETVSRHHRGTCDGEGAGGGIGETQTARRDDLNPESEGGFASIRTGAGALRSRR